MNIHCGVKITKKTLYWQIWLAGRVHELMVSARTCTEPLSELVSVSVGCGEVPELASGRRRCIWGCWRLQTVHASDHCDLWRCKLLRQDQVADKCPTCKSHSRQKCTFYVAQRGQNCCLASVPRVAGALFTAKYTSVSQNNARAAYLAMPSHADD